MIDVYLQWKHNAIHGVHIAVHCPCRNVSGSDLISQLREEAHEWPDRRVYVILHSIDGPGLRGEEEQALLADMAACPNVHLLASCDHVNTPLMWSTALAARFRSVLVLVGQQIIGMPVWCVVGSFL